MSLTTTIAEEVCPACGDFVESLNPSTGFCLDCSPKVCSRCGGVPSIGHNVCIKCQRQLWWERNADQLEYYLSQGLSLAQARERVNRENAAFCICCGSQIPGRNRQTTLFCTRTQRCKTAKRRYTWRIEQGIPKDLALEAVVEALIRERKEGENLRTC